MSNRIAGGDGTGSRAKTLARWTLRLRVPILVFFALLAVPSVVLLLGIRIDNSTDIWFRKSSETFRSWERFLEEFGSDRLFIVAYERDDVFSPEALKAFARACDELRALKGVESVADLLSAPVSRMTPAGPAAAAFLDPVPETPEALARARERALATPLFAGNLVSADGRTLFAFAAVATLTLEEKVVLVREARAVTDRLAAAGGTVILAGMPFIEVEFDRLTRRENAIFVPLSLTVIVAVLFALFPSPRLVAVVLPALVLSVGLTLAVFILLGYRFNLMTSLVPPLLLAIGVANVVHILVQVREELNRGLAPRDALAEGLGRMFRPCLFTSLTTSAGFFSLALADIPPLQEAGMLGGAGILLAFAMSFTFFPAALSFLPPAVLHPQGLRIGVLRRLLERTLVAAYGISTRKALPVLLLAAGLLALSGAGIAQLRPETNVIRFFRPANPVRSGWTALEDRGVSITAVEILFSGPPGTFRDPAVIERIRQAGERLDERDEIRRCFSLADVLDHAAAPLGGRRAPAPARSAVLGFLEARPDPGGRRFHRAYVNADASRARLSARTIDRGTHERTLLVGWVSRTLAAEFPDLGPFEINGTAQLFARIDEMILEGQLRMAGVAFAAVFVMTLILLRSVSLSALAMIPNLLPILVTLGLMGWTGIPLDVGTMIIAGVAVGIAVDDTIHYLTRYGRERKERGSPVTEALRASHLSVGRAMVFTSLLLLTGFGIIGLSAFRPVYTFGVLTGLTMAMALLGDLLLLPALLFVTGRVRERREEAAPKTAG